MATYDLKYPGAAIDAILDTAYDLQNAGYIFRGLASEYSNTPTERSWVLAGEGETGHGFTSPVPKGYIGVCVFNGTSWTGKLLKCVSIDSAPTSGSTNAISSGGAYASISQLADTVNEALDNLTFTDTTPSAFLGDYINMKVSTTDGGLERILTYFTILAATASKAGLLSAADKAKLDALWSSGYQFAGIATPSTTPVSTTSKIFYIATEAGTYFNAVTVTQGINIIYKSGDTWSVAQVVGIDNEPTAGSDRLVKSGGVFGELALGAVYDVSAKNPTAGPNSNGKWESLSALLSDANLNTLIPTSVRKGGMSIKYVQSSDNKYVQFRCMTQNFTTDITQWQGVDDEPTVGSDNLVKSGGVDVIMRKDNNCRPIAKENNGNLIFSSDIIFNKRYDYDGSSLKLINTDSWNCTPLIKVKKNTIYTKSRYLYVIEYSDDFTIVAVHITNSEPESFTTTSTTEFVTVSFGVAVGTPRFNEGSTLNPYVEGEPLFNKNQIKGLTEDSETLNNLVGEVANCYRKQETVGKNKFNKNAVPVAEGMYYAPDDGSLQRNTAFNSYNISLGIEPNKNYVVSGLSDNAEVVAFDDNGNFIENSGVALNVNLHITTFRTPANVAYIGLSVRTADNETFQLEEGSSSTEYEPYSIIIGVDGKDILPGTIAGSKLEPSLEIKKVLRVGSTRKYSSILEALKDGGSNCRVIVDAGIYDIEQEYKDFYGDDFFANYPLDGYHSQTDKFYAGLWLAPGVQLVANGLVTITFPYDDGTRQSELPHDDPNYDPVAQYFSVLNPTYNCVVDGIDISLVLNNCRYHIHDDFATAAGTNVFRNVHLSGTAQKQTAFGCGMGTKNIYVIENCKITDNLISISYHNNTNAGKNKLIIKDTFCSGNIAARMYGSSTQITEVVVSGCKANHIYKDYVNQTDYPNENMELIEWNNTTVS